MAKRELMATIRERCQHSSKKEKGRILDEFRGITGHHRKHGTRLLNQPADEESEQVAGGRIYDEAVREAVIVQREAPDRICGKGLKAALPDLVDSLDRHGHSSLHPEVLSRPLSVTSATLNRLRKPIRSTRAAGANGDEGRPWAKRIPVRTCSNWNRSPPGFLEIDLVAHRGGALSGYFIHSLVASETCTGCNEAVPLLTREQSLLIEGLQAIAGGCLS